MTSPLSSATIWGLAVMATTSIVAIYPRTRSRNRAMITSRSTSVYKSLLLRIKIDRLPIWAKSCKGLYSDCRRSLSTTNRSKSASVANFRANFSLSVPATPASRMPGVSVIKIWRLIPFSFKV